MPVAGSSFTEVMTDQTHTGDTNFNVEGTIADTEFTNGDDYLVLVRAAVGGSVNTTDYEFQLAHGGTAFADTVMTFRPSVAEGTARWVYWTWVKWTAVAGEAITFEQRTLTSTSTVHANHITMFALNLSDLAAADHQFAERTTDDGLSTTWLAGASITWTPDNANDDWLVFTTSTISASNTIHSGESRQDLDGAAVNDLMISSENDISTADFVHTLATVYTLSAASHTIEEQSRENTGTSMTREYSAIIAIRLNAFEDHFNGFTITTVDLSATDWFDELETETFTPTQTGDFLCLAFYIFDTASTNTGANVRLQVDQSDEPGASEQTDDVIPYNRGFDSINEYAMPMFARLNLDTTSHVVDMDASVTNAAGAKEGSARLVAGFSLELVAAAFPGEENGFLPEPPGPDPDRVAVYS